MQVYFLSVLFNLLIGISLVSKRFNISSIFSGKEKAAVMTAGVCCVITGILKLIFVVDTDIIIIGDLLPALAGITGGICYLSDYYNSTSEVKIQFNSFFERLFVAGKKYIGAACIVIAVVHFLFPAVSIL